MVDIFAYVLLVAAFMAREYTSYKEKQYSMNERSELLNRIKPETAVLSNLTVPEMVEQVRSDEDYWEAHEKQIKDEGSYPYGYEEEVKGR